ncbi:MAG: hypothetical protein ISR76_07485 [Planctomycetes bacterium]|nr:hypothetical protein [Planctomycetota bacterium]MBL7008825.1 hypothetical protein [Planctomycetota bacterium]
MLVQKKWIAAAVAGLALGGGLAAQAATPAKTGVPAAKIQPAPKQDAQDPAEQQAKFQASYAEKLKKEFIAHGGWITDWEAARAKAKAEGKVIFTYFSRSYAP